MVTCKLFGGLCNQLFQIAACIGYARRYGMDYCIPMQSAGHWPWYKIDRVVYCMSDIRTMYHYKEPAIFYEQRPYNIRHQDIPLKNNILLEGHFQSEKYFEHCSDEIRKLFSNWTSEYGWVSIHVRRGDYLAMQGHLPVVDLGYLRKAITYMGDHGKTQFAVFGDDYEWNKANINENNFPGLRFDHLRPMDPWKDLWRASHCHHNIGSNSSFSWWIHYLNWHRDKIGIFPEKWFGPAYGEVDTTDLYLPGVIKM